MNKLSLNTLCIKQIDYINLNNYDSNDYCHYARATSFSTLNLAEHIKQLYSATTIINNALEYNCICVESTLILYHALFDALIASDNYKIYCSNELYSEILISASRTYNDSINTINIDHINEYELSSKPGVYILDCPTNPYLNEYNVHNICKYIKDKNNNNIIIFDNTLYSVYWYNPFNDYVDIVIESLTKHCGGHGDAFGGAIIFKNNKLLYTSMRKNLSNIGSHMNSFDCYLIDRGLSTLPLRMEHIKNSVETIYEYFKNTLPIKACPKAGLIIIGLPNNETMKTVIQQMKLFINTSSFGYDHSCASTADNFYLLHKMPDDFKYFIRLGIGLEDPNDLINDLNQALKSVVKN